MGKDSAIKSLSRSIGILVMHELLLKHTLKPESSSHLKFEIEEYGDIAFEKAQEFNWNEADKIKVAEESLFIVNKIKSKKYPDISFDKKEAEDLIEELIDEIL